MISADHGQPARRACWGRPFVGGFCEFVVVGLRTMGSPQSNTRRLSHLQLSRAVFFQRVGAPVCGRAPNGSHWDGGSCNQRHGLHIVVNNSTGSFLFVASFQPLRLLSMATTWLVERVPHASMKERTGDHDTAN
jgi:hypothetical protein